MKLKLYNTLTRTIEEFTPINENEVTVYCCGPTVYSYQHIGNFKTFINEDTLIRTLRFLDYKVKHVINITDVGHTVGDTDGTEDKMSVAKKREKKTALEIAEFYTDKFFKDWEELNLSTPSIICKATDHIIEMIELIKRLMAKGLAYEANGNVYFNVEAFKGYGELAKLDLEKLKAGARIDVDQHKKNPADFALWFTNSKFKDHELEWDSPWGTGYPGWHIECSAMSLKYLGEHFDIHCGGIDHIPVHHTNEIAQTEGATGRKWVNYWFHTEHMHLNNEKIAKSTGNMLLIDDLKQMGFEANVFKFLVYSTSYRKQMNFSKDSLENAKRNLSKLKNLYLAIDETASKLSKEAEKFLIKFKEALTNDLNLQIAISIVWEVFNSDINDSEKKLLVNNFDQVFGFGVKAWVKNITDTPKEVIDLLNKRNQAKENKNWADADLLRDKIKELGYIIKDSKDGSSVIKI